METKLKPARKHVRTCRHKEKGIEAVEAERMRSEKERVHLDTLEFIQAIDRFKRRTLKVFPTWSEVLEILRCLGYRKVSD